MKAAREKQAAESEEEAPEPEKPEAEAGEPAPEPSSSAIAVNTVSFEQLRELGLSVTQATRVIAYREQQDGFTSVDDLDGVPGLPNDLLGELKGKLTA